MRTVVGGDDNRSWVVGTSRGKCDRCSTVTAGARRGTAGPTYVPPRLATNLAAAPPPAGKRLSSRAASQPWHETARLLASSAVGGVPALGQARHVVYCTGQVQVKFTVAGLSMSCFNVMFRGSRTTRRGDGQPWIFPGAVLARGMQRQCWRGRAAGQGGTGRDGFGQCAELISYPARQREGKRWVPPAVAGHPCRTGRPPSAAHAVYTAIRTAGAGTAGFLWVPVARREINNIE